MVRCVYRHVAQTAILCIKIFTGCKLEHSQFFIGNQIRYLRMLSTPFACFLVETDIRLNF